MTYILIMSIWIATYAAQPVAISTVEFTSEQACRYAGTQQEATLRNTQKRNLLLNKRESNAN